MFFVFVGTLALGLGKVGLAAGIVSYVLLAFNAYVLYVNKDMKSGNAMEYHPYGQEIEESRQDFGSAAKDYIAQNPDVARSALSFAAKNPDTSQAASKLLK